MLNFSIVLIAKNEAETLPRLLASLDKFHFKERGGEVVVLDTGSTDKTVEVARNWGCKVEEVADKFIEVIDKEKASAINEKFSVSDTGIISKIVKEGERVFNFGAARNYAASLASNDFIWMPDCDEIFTALYIDEIESKIKEGYGQLEFNFVFAHGPNGEEIVKFIQCKAYDRTKLQWRGKIHEVLTPIVSTEIKRVLLPESIVKIEHYQNEKTNRAGYLSGLALDCYENPDYDRNSHYFAREMWWRGYPEEAIKEFKRYLTISWWDAERSKSMVFIGDILLSQGKDREALRWYYDAYLECLTTREPLIKIGKYFFDKKDWARCIFHLEGCLNIKYSGFYADDTTHYGDYPYSMLYVAYWWLNPSDELKLKSKEYFEKAVALNPNNPVYIAESKFYRDEPIKPLEYGENGIEGWMSPIELNWLYCQAKEIKNGRIIEIGSWKGRSTHALLSGAEISNSRVFAIDHFKGSQDEGDGTNSIGKRENIREQFDKNVKDVNNNLEVIQFDGITATNFFTDGQLDMVFIDAGHTYREVCADITWWKNKIKIGGLLCGHDYCDAWPEVKTAVNDMLKGGPDGVIDSIWYKVIK
jgi:glycosyltransferase involved in cell wall biosynthesis